MTKTLKEAAPTVLTNTMPADFLAGVRVIDAKTGEPIAGVIEADATAGTVSRFDIEDGNLVREGDAFRIVNEKRAIRIEWIEPAGEAA